MGKKIKLITGDREEGAMEEQVAKFHNARGRAPFGSKGKDVAKEAKPSVQKGKRFVGFATRGKATGSYKL